jgi:hypothetical protein
LWVDDIEAARAESNAAGVKPAPMQRRPPNNRYRDTNEQALAAAVGAFRDRRRFPH